MTEPANTERKPHRIVSFMGRGPKRFFLIGVATMLIAPMHNVLFVIGVIFLLCLLGTMLLNILDQPSREE